MNSPHFARLLAALLLPALTACANLKPVATFGAGATAVAGAYRPFVQSMEAYCLKSRASSTLQDSGAYNYQQLTDGAKAECQPIIDKKETALEFATVVEGYGAVLAELSGLKGDALTADIAALGDTAAKLKTKAGDDIFNGNVLGAASKLASGIVELALGARITKVTRQALVDAQEPLAVTVGAMKTFVTRLYPPVLNNYANDIGRLERLLQAESTWTAVPGDDSTSVANRRRALPFRLLQPMARTELAEVDRQRASIQKFEQACDALLVAHKELAEQFDEKTAPDQRAALKDFMKKAKALRDSIQKI